MMERVLEEPPPTRLKESEAVENGFTDSNNSNHHLEKVRIGSRKSQLALFQTNFVANLLRRHNTDLSYDIVSMTTTGDKILDVALSKIGQKSLFTKELEVALEKEEVHMVVHSLKDLPTTLPEGMVIGAICKRENPFDAVVFSSDNDCKDLKDLPNGSVVGTSSLRRIAQLRKIHPHLKFESIRGNLNTRLRKLDENKVFSALILAAAGVIRLDLERRIGKILTPKECMYAVGQGALAVECRAEDVSTIRLLSKIADEETTLCCIAERAFMKSLEGGCSVPLAVHSYIQNKELTLKGGVFSLDGSKHIIDKLSSNIYEDTKHDALNKHYTGVVAAHIPSHVLGAAETLGKDLAKLFLQKGAADILKEAREENTALSALDK